MKTVKKVMKKTTNRKKAVTLKNKTFYGLVNKSSLKPTSGNRWMDIEAATGNINHSVNSFLTENGSGELKDMMIVKIEVVGKAEVKREITIKK